MSSRIALRPVGASVDEATLRRDLMALRSSGVRPRSQGVRRLMSWNNASPEHAAPAHFKEVSDVLALEHPRPVTPSLQHEGRSDTRRCARCHRGAGCWQVCSSVGGGGQLKAQEKKSLLSVSGTSLRPRWTVCTCSVRRACHLRLDGRVACPNPRCRWRRSGAGRSV